jgi:hypothetical protein
MADRVEKGWQAKGLATSSKEALFGTLGHYGVTVDEKGFLSLGKNLYPLRIAEKWHESWKGTGQFAHFPEAAAEELYRRLFPDTLRPSAFSVSVAELIGSLEGQRREVSDSEKNAKFESVEALLKKIPQMEEKPSEAFIEELVFHLDTFWERFNHLSEQLARGGQVAEAERFLKLEEALFPERKGVASAVMEAAKGNREKAVAALEDIASSRTPDFERRLSAVDALLHLEALDSAKSKALALMTEAHKAGLLHEGLEAASRLDFIFEKQGTTPADEAVIAQMNELVEAHEKAHPHHVHD